MKASGPNEPVAANDSVENMAKNRRVEVTLLRDELDMNDPDVIKDILKYDFKLPTEEFDPQGQKPADPSTLPEGSADKIIRAIKDRYDSQSTGGATLWPGLIDSSEFVVSTDDKSEEKSE